MMWLAHPLAVSAALVNAALLTTLSSVPSAVMATTTQSKTCNADESSDGCRNPDMETDEDDVNCIDDHGSCEEWMRVGECKKNPNYMLQSCRKSCNVCGKNLVMNNVGDPQAIPEYPYDEVMSILESSEIYMQQIWNDPKYEPVWKDCRNNEARCSQWALGTGCDDNPKYMKQHCAPACHSCDTVLELKEMCKPDPDKDVDAIKPGELNGLFERMVRVSSERGFEPKVWSRPPKPWVLTLEKFLSEQEISTLLHWGAKHGYERSQAGDAILDVRTSSHSWCTDDCYNDPAVIAVRERIEDVTGIKHDNYECLQLLKYDIGQFYKPHNDFIENHKEQIHGPRILTIFMYFDEVEEGGGTSFPQLGNLTINPRKGRVLIWPSVRDEDPNAEDSRTEHEAEPVLKGSKYAANAWVHLRDFQTGFHMGCPS